MADVQLTNRARRDGQRMAICASGQRERQEKEQAKATNHDLFLALDGLRAGSWTFC
jgi:hypothetical protein